MNDVYNVVKKAFAWLEQTSNPKTGFEHPRDETRMKESIKALYSFGEIFDDSLLEYVKKIGWPEKVIEKIKKRFNDAANGKLKYRDYSESFFREHWKIEESDLRPKEHLDSIESCPLWNGKEIVWEKLKNVNILVGINGSGKTTFLNHLYDFISGENRKIDLTINTLLNRVAPVTYIRAIDNSLVDKKKNIL